MQGVTGGVPVATSGTVTASAGTFANTATQGPAAAAAGAWPFKITDATGSGTVAVKTSSVAAAADPALVVTVSPYSYQPQPALAGWTSGQVIGAAGTFMTGVVAGYQGLYIVVPATSTFVGTLNGQIQTYAGGYRTLPAINVETGQKVTNISSPGTYFYQITGDAFQLSVPAYTSGTMTLVGKLSGGNMGPSVLALDQTTQAVTNGVAAALIPLKFRTAALTNAGQAVKAGAGAVYGWTFINVNAAVVYVKFYDALTVTVGTTPVAATRMVPAGGTLFVDNQMVRQLNLATGIMIAATANIADADTTAPATAIMAEVQYQ